ncbi:hypothetical protein HDF18_03225 [Mucilaginibacter sp. X5P1]|uniref:hypothetical protein n=1 Tax=Mucilaginibacter sp. X5P1 TaxID=2723088 RepID=UPI001610FE5B|nr:hypothetical protein [Mucilaginibacter sp. X5P1]MBB6136622.1 hypothetical protein [Mucilaginibacter sp. X5P1]
MKKIFYLYSAIILAFIITTYSCKKSTIGFLSPYVHYEQNPIYVPKGRTFLGSALNPDGSSMPFTATVVHYYNKANGQIVDSLFSKKFPVQIFTGYIDPTKDTTFQQIVSFLKTESLPAVTILPNSGQVSANAGALYLPAGEYQYDLKITNEAGTKIYPKIGDFILVDTTNFDAVPAIGSTSETRILVGNESKSSVGKLPLLTVTRVADTPNIITVVYKDKNGTPWNPQAGEVVSRPAAGLNPIPPYLQSLQEYTSSYYYTPTSSVFRFPLVPFPLNTLGNAFNIYQRIPAKYVNNDGLPAGAYTLNLRFPIRIYVPGSYLVVEQSVDATRVP